MFFNVIVCFFFVHGSKLLSKRKRHKTVYLAFIEAPRMCTGVRFALAQTKAALMAIIRDFKVVLSPKQKLFVMDNRAFTLLARDGLWVNLIPK